LQYHLISKQEIFKHWAAGICMQIKVTVLGHIKHTNSDHMYKIKRINKTHLNKFHVKFTIVFKQELLTLIKQNKIQKNKKQ
jgi:hypothetical protein